MAWIVSGHVTRTGTLALGQNVGSFTVHVQCTHTDRGTFSLRKTLVHCLTMPTAANYSRHRKCLGGRVYRYRYCSCRYEREFSEMLVSYLGVDSPAASSPGVLGASFSGYSGGRQRFVVDAGGWEVERVQMPGDGWRDAHEVMITSPPPSSTSSLSLGFQAPWSRVASSAWLFRPRSWPLHWPRMAAVARGLAQSQTIASRSTVVACCTT